MLIVLAVMLLVSTSCGGASSDTDGGSSGETESSVASSGEGSATTAADVAVETTTSVVGGGSLDDPIPPGEWAGVGNVDVVVLAVNTDAADEVIAENDFNDPPAAGNRFVMWNVGLANASDEALASLGEVSFTVVGPSSVAYDAMATCGVLPGELDVFRDVFPGGSLSGNLCWEVAEADADDLVLLVDEFALIGDRVAFAAADSTTPIEVTYPTPVPPDPDGPVGTRGNPYPVGETVSVGDWEIEVTGITADATDDVMEENPYNDPPADGSQFMMVSIDATYAGSASEALEIAASFNVVGNRAVSYTFEDACGLIPDEIDSFAEVFPGGTVSGNMCWSVPSDDVDGIVMYVRKAFSFDEETQFLAVR